MSRRRCIAEACRVLINDLENGVLPLDENDMSAADAWDQVYSHMPEFTGVTFHQFKMRLQWYRKQAKKRIEAATEAVNLLAEDVAQGKHLALGIEGLHQSRPEYLALPLSGFRDHVDEFERQRAA